MESKKKQKVISYKDLGFPVLMLLLVFFASVFALNILYLETLPQFQIGQKVYQKIVFQFDFQTLNRKQQEKNKMEFEQKFPLVYRKDQEKNSEIQIRLEQFLQEMSRRSECETKKIEYQINTEREQISKIVKGLQEDLFSKLVREMHSISDDASFQMAYSLYVRMQSLLNKGIVEEISDELEDARYILIDGERTFQEEPVSSLDTVNTAVNRLVLYLSQDPSLSQTDLNAATVLLKKILSQGNVVKDDVLRKQKMEMNWMQEREEIREPLQLYAKGDALFPVGHIFSADDIDFYECYKHEFEQRQIIGRNRCFYGIPLNKFLLAFLWLVFCGVFLVNFFPELCRCRQDVFLLSLIVFISLIVNYIYIYLLNCFPKSYSVPVYLILPLGIPALVISSIYGARVALFSSVYVCGILALSTRYGFETMLVGLFVNGLLALTVRHVYHISQFFVRAIFCTFFPVFISMFFLMKPENMLFYLRTVKKLLLHDIVFSPYLLVEELVFIFLTSLVTAFISLLLLQIFDCFRKISTNFSYQKVLRKNHLLIKELKEKAPGTYRHSIHVSKLAMRAAESVRANSSKAFAFSLFHDIGKLKSPDVFIENGRSQTGLDGVFLEENAKIIRQHVDDGCEIAKRKKLKDEIVEAISQHHGDDRILYVYNKEQERLGNNVDDMRKYTYSGTIPMELESTILMLAGCCEAAVSAMRDADDEEIRNKVEEIFHGKFERKQLDHSKITLEELARIKESFIATLLEEYHSLQKIQEAEVRKENV